MSTVQVGVPGHRPMLCVVGLVEYWMTCWKLDHPILGLGNTYRDGCNHSSQRKCPLFWKRVQTRYMYVRMHDTVYG